MKVGTLAGTMFLCVAVGATCAADKCCAQAPAGSTAVVAVAAAPDAGAAQIGATVLPKPGSKVEIGGGFHFTYGFTDSPKMGACIMRVEVFDADGKPDTSFAVKGDADMPAMKGAHAAGEKNFAVSRKGAYLMPVQIAMPGEWEMTLTFAKDGKPVFRGLYRFKI